MPQSPTLYQKGANGLIAEYECAMHLHSLLSDTAYCTPSRDELMFLRDQEIGKFTKELTSGQIDRAKAQGQALAGYLAKNIRSSPADLGLPRNSCLGIHPASRSARPVMKPARETVPTFK